MPRALDSMLRFRRVLFCAVILPILCSVAWSQAPLIKSMRSDFAMSGQKQGTKSFLLSYWDGSATSIMAFGFMHHPGVRKGFGVSEDQFAEMQKAQGQIGALVQKDPK
ncbi:hypothetical protein FACS1894170_02570 [Planctomycetales bacterium]|nr:hypothetical protein FACS1894170_02570 [Planctomycetales bacterium]